MNSPHIYKEIQQIESLKKCLNYVVSKSAFYKHHFYEHFQNHRIEDLSLEAFYKLPLTSKKDIQFYNTSFQSCQDEEIAEFMTTSGTLGKPVNIILSKSDMARLTQNEFMSLRIAGITSKDRVQITTTLDKRFMAGIAYFLGLQKLGASTIRVGVGSLELQFDSIDRFRPTVLIGVPSFIIKMINYALFSGISLQELSIEKIICIGEPIRNNDFTLNKVGAFITKYWTSQLHSTYASTEMATAFTECEFGLGGHELPGLIFTEILNNDLQHCTDGQTGELVITTLGVTGMPLVRYRTDDILSKFNQKCPCGLDSSRLGPVLGRKNQMIKYKGTSFYAASIQQICDHLTELESYIIEVFSDQFGLDDILISIATRVNKQDILQKMSAQFQSQLRVNLKIQIKPNTYILELQNHSENRKPRTFVDHRKQII